MRTTPGRRDFEGESCRPGLVEPRAIARAPWSNWIELIVALYSLGLVAVYLKPEALLPAIEQTLTVGALSWVAWVILAAVTGLLALAALVVTFCLLYAPVYLLVNAWRILDAGAWVDQREVRFYVGCLACLCALLALGVLSPRAALASFTLLVGWAPIAARLLL